MTEGAKKKRSKRARVKNAMHMSWASVVISGPFFRWELLLRLHLTIFSKFFGLRLPVVHSSLLMLLPCFRSRGRRHTACPTGRSAVRWVGSRRTSSPSDCSQKADNPQHEEIVVPLSMARITMTTVPAPAFEGCFVGIVPKAHRVSRTGLNSAT